MAAKRSAKVAQRSVKLKDHTILALDIGTRYIKIAEMRFAKGTISLLNIAVRPTPAGMTENGQVSDPVGMGKTIREMLATSKIATRRVIVAVNGQSSVVVRPIELPKMTRKELADTMKFEVERHIPFTVDEVVMDYAPLIESENLPEDASNMKVLLAVAQEDLINTYLKLLSVAGLQPVVMDVEIMATIRALVNIHQQAGEVGETVALVNIGASNTEISIIENGLLTFTRSVPIAGDALTQAICDQLGRNFDEAEELKKEHGYIFLESAVDALAPPVDEETHGGAESASTSFFDAYGAEPAAPASPTSSLMPQNIFSLDEEFDMPGPIGLGGAESPGAGGAAFQLEDGVNDDVSTPFLLGSEADEIDRQFEKPSSAPAPRFGTDEKIDDNVNTPFLLGPTDDDVTTIFRMQPDDEEGGGATPVFDLDDNVDDDVSIPFLLRSEEDEEDGGLLTGAKTTYASPVEAPSISPNDAPVFSFSSELEGQLPTPLSRPTPSAGMADESVEEEAFAFNPHTEMQDVFADPAEDATGDDALDYEATPFVPTNTLAATPAYERPDVPQSDVFQRRIYESMLPALTELVTEIRRSLEYYSSRAPDVPIERILLYGGTSSLPNLPEFIYQELGLTVERANPLAAIDLESSRQSSAYVNELAPALPIVIGLGLRDMIA